MKDLAKEYAKKYHNGQYRKGNGLPYVVHPANVADYLGWFGFDDDVTLSVGWLHDIVEDTPFSLRDVIDVFGKEVACGVMYLTRDVDNDAYKRRLACAPDNIKMVKLCDTLDNVRTLDALSPLGIEKKVVDCLEYYIPMALDICPMMGLLLMDYIGRFNGMEYFKTTGTVRQE